jgi:hypothetical protein
MANKSTEKIAVSEPLIQLAAMIQNAVNWFAETDQKVAEPLIEKLNQKIHGVISETVHEVISEGGKWAHAQVILALTDNLSAIYEEAERIAEEELAQANANGRYLQRTAYPDTVAAPRSYKARKPAPVAK